MVEGSDGWTRRGGDGEVMEGEGQEAEGHPLSTRRSRLPATAVKSRASRVLHTEKQKASVALLTLGHLSTLRHPARMSS